MSRIGCQRADVLLTALQCHLSRRATWTTPEGGMFLMVRLPGLDGKQLLARTSKENLAIVPGEEFHHYSVTIIL